MQANNAAAAPAGGGAQIQVGVSHDGVAFQWVDCLVMGNRSQTPGGTRLLNGPSRSLLVMRQGNENAWNFLIIDGRCWEYHPNLPYLGRLGRYFLTEG
jgi:hypothetical protein